MREIWIAMVFGLALAGGHPAFAQVPKTEIAPGGTPSAANMASLLAPYGNAQASAVARQLDEKVVALLTASAE